MKPFDPAKPCQTRDGRKARIVCTDAKGGYPILALVEHYSCAETETTGRYTSDGRLTRGGCDCKGDLVNVPVKREGWVNVYEDRLADCTYVLSPTREIADQLANKHTRIACVKIEWEEA